MNAALPDVSLTDIAPRLSPLAWGGMQGIDLPVTVAESGYRRELHARADVQVDLPAPHVKGIHMSRLYRLLDALGQREALRQAPRLLAARQALTRYFDSLSKVAQLSDLPQVAPDPEVLEALRNETLARPTAGDAPSRSHKGVGLC